MHEYRRAVLATVAGVVTAGCLGGEGDGSTPSPSPSPGDSGTPSPTLESCDPEDVTRPPIVRDSDHPPQGYGTKPMELSEQSVADYLSDFETAFAWNRILHENDDVESLGVNTVDGYTPTAAGNGYLSSSRIETHYTVAGADEPTERAYVTNYFVSGEPVYRVETESEPTDPRTHADRQLVQCGPE